jgi:hypothetical protein
MWSLTQRDKCKLQVFKNEVLKKISGPNKDEVGNLE